MESIARFPFYPPFFLFFLYFYSCRFFVFPSLKLYVWSLNDLSCCCQLEINRLQTRGDRKVRKQWRWIRWPLIHDSWIGDIQDSRRVTVLFHQFNKVSSCFSLSLTIFKSLYDSKRQELQSFVYWVVRKVISFLCKNFVSYVSLYLTLLRTARLFYFLTCGTKWSVYNRIEYIAYMNKSTFIFS